MRHTLLCIAFLILVGIGVLGGYEPIRAQTEPLFPWDRSLEFRFTGGPHGGGRYPSCPQAQVEVSRLSGLDFGMREQEVLAITDGIIQDFGWHNVVGYYVVVDHVGWSSESWHLKSIEPSIKIRGLSITRGRVLGLSGDTGSGALGSFHLHLEVSGSWHGRSINGWTVRSIRVQSDTSKGFNYEGTMTKGSVTKVASTARTSSNAIESDNYRLVKQFKPYRTWIPYPGGWPYLFDASDSRVSRFTVDDWFLWDFEGSCDEVWVLLDLGHHSLNFWYESRGSGAPTINVYPWPLGELHSSTCAAGPPDTPDERPTTTDNATFTGYETIPDDTAVSPGQSLVKTWRLRNTGTTTWGSGYKFVFRSGNRLGAPDVNVPTVPLEQEVNLSVPLQIPANLASNTYTGHWQLRDPQGKFFGPDLWVSVEVISSNPGSGHITVFDVSNPSSASIVHLVGRARYFSEYRSMRFVIGNDKHEETNFRQVGDQNEISYDWNTAGLPPGTYTLAFEVATNGDPDWANPERWVRTYTLTGTGSSGTSSF